MIECEHCDGSGFLLVQDYGADEDGRMVSDGDAYDSPCHFCPAGRAFIEVMRIVEQDPNGEEL